MNQANSQFAAVLEDALSSPENFHEIIGKHLQPLNSEKLQTLTNALESAGVVSRGLIGALFENLGDTGAQFLVERLDSRRQVLFVEAAAILGKMQYEGAVPAFKAVIQQKNADLVLPAVKALALMKPSRQVDSILVDFYMTYDDEAKLFASIRYLLPRRETLVHEMLERYRGLNPDRRMWVLKFLAETENEEAFRLFAEELDTAPLERGLYCISGIGRIRKPESVAALQKHLSNPEWFLRKRIVEALGQTMQADAVAPILNMLDDESVQVRAAAVESLSKIGNLNPGLILKKLKSAAGHVKINLIRAMGQLKNEKFVEPLIEELKDRKSLFFTIDALGDLGFARAEMPLRRLLKDSEWFNRLNALEALAKLPLDNLMQIAQESQQDENDMVRNSAGRIVAARQIAK